MKDAGLLSNDLGIAPNLKWIHLFQICFTYTLIGLKRFSFNEFGIHEKAGEFGLMSILMLQNHMTKEYQSEKKEFVLY